MQHVDPASVAPSPSADPHGFVSFAHARSVFPLAALVDGSRKIVWRRGRTSGLTRNLREDPVGFDLVWEAISARTYIEAARSCGLVLAPWYSFPAGGDPLKDRKGGVMETGESIDGPNDYGVATKRFLKHPDRSSADGCRPGMVFDALCHEFGVRLEDVDFAERVTAKIKEQEAARARDRRDDKKLIRLCKKAFELLFEDNRLEIANSEATDAFALAEKPCRPIDGFFPSAYRDMSYAEASAALREARRTPKDKLDYLMVAALVTGRLKAFVDSLKAYEAKIAELEKEHGLAAARNASHAARGRALAILGKIVELPAITAAGLSEKCQLMNYCLDCGWGLSDEFQALAESIFDDGVALGRPKR